MTIEKGSLTFQESTIAVKEKFENLQTAQDRRKIEELIDNYVTYFPYAMNFGHEGYITDYIDPESPLYDELFDFILYASQQNIWEELENYRIDNVVLAKDGLYYVVCEECFSTYTHDRSVGTTNVFKNTYKVRKKGERFYITAVDFLNLLNRL